MQPLTIEWINKAEADFQSALREYRAKKFPNFDSACFHAQQCAEKYIKAILQESNTPFPKTHDIVSLIKLIPDHPAEWLSHIPHANRLTAYGVQFRYPGSSADKALAKEAIQDAKNIRTLARKQLNFNPL